MSQYLLLFIIFAPFCFAPVLYFITRSRRSLGFPLTSVITLAELGATVVLFLFPDDAQSVSFLTLTFSADGFHSLYAVVTSFAWLVSSVFSLEYFAHYDGHGRYIFFFLLTLGAVEGVFLSADLLSTFIFFEIASFASFVWILHDKTREAISAAKTYLSVAVFGGMLLLLGILYLSPISGSLSFDALSQSPAVPYVIGVLLLLGFGAKAGMFPLHIWLPKAHPVAPAPASALLSGILTKVGVYGVIVTSVRLYFGDVKWGTVLLIFGIITLLLGAFLALVSTNLKRTLACSSMSQIGFILTGIAAVSILGEEGALAAAGVVLYMLNHSMMKLILFSAAGVVYMKLHHLNLDDIRGWGRGRPLLAVMFALGGLGLAGFPLTGGYIAKTLIHEAIVECAEVVPFASIAEWLFLFGGGCTLAYMIKLFVILFVEKPAKETERTRTMSPISSAVLTLSLIPAILTGIPSVSLAIAQRSTGFVRGGGHEASFDAPEFFGWECLSGALITISIGIALYFIFVRTVTRRGGVYRDILPAWADLERSVYVPAIHAVVAAGGSVLHLFGENVITRRACRAASAIAAVVCHALSDTTDAAIYLLRRTVFRPLREKKSRRSHPIIDAVYDEMATLGTGTPDNFSYSLIVTCVGICVILLFLLIVPHI